MSNVFTNRFEIKYLLNQRDYGRLKSKLDGALLEDVNGSYYIQSIYFDSSDYSFYQEKREGLLIREKPRLRVYRKTLRGNIVSIFLEIKYRRDRTVFKDRIKLDAKQAVALLNNRMDTNLIRLLNDQCPRFLFLDKKYGLKPVSNIFYHREPYYSTIYPKVRVTFDRSLRSTRIIPGLDLPLESRYFLDPRLKIFELKYNNKTPTILMDTIQALNLMQFSVSKYAMSVENNIEHLCDKVLR